MHDMQIIHAIATAVTKKGKHKWNKQESCAIAKTTARCALYIGYSTIIFSRLPSYVHYFVRIWFWTNLSWSDSAHWSNVDFEQPIVVTSSTQRRMPPRAQTSFTRIVLDGDAPSAMEPPRMLYFIFLETKIMGLHFVADSIFIIFITD